MRCIHKLWICDPLCPSIKVFACVNLWQGSGSHALAHLLQRGVRNPVAGQAKVSQRQVQFLKEQAKGPISGSGVGQYVGDLLTDAL